MALDTTRDGALPMEVARPLARRRLGWLGGLLAASDRRYRLKVKAQAATATIAHKAGAAA